MVIGRGQLLELRLFEIIFMAAQIIDVKSNYSYSLQKNITSPHKPKKITT